MRNRNRCTILTISLLLATVAAAQEDAGQGLQHLVRGNETFGRKLLQQVHSAEPTRNVVVAPLPVTIIFAAIHASDYGKNEDEIGTAFGWGNEGLAIPAHMLLAAFEKPDEKICPTPKFCYTPSGDWLTSTFLYHTAEGVGDPISPDFRKIATKYFGMNFVSLGTKGQASEPNDAWIQTRMHLQSGWAGNTFSVSDPYPGKFHAASGAEQTVQMLDSELESYLYAKTDSFEAAALPGMAYMIAVLPAKGKDIHDLERELAEQPEALDAALHREIGDVTMPVFHIVFQSDLRTPIMTLGIRHVFEDLDKIIKIQRSHLTKVDQAVDIRVNQNGIRADAETVTSLTVGGILAAKRTFHLQLNRPFIFLIRDQITNSLLFMGAVMDPTEK